MHRVACQGRRTALGTILLLGIAALGVGCKDEGAGNGDAVAMDCAWLSGSNCWKDSLAAAQLCLPADTEEGIFDAIHGSCTYADGTLVSFVEPGWDVVVSRDGVTCLAFVELNPGYRLETSAGVLEFEATDPAEPVTCHCPDGSQATTPDYQSLYQCDGFIDSLPSITTSSNYLELNGGPNNEPVMVYNCRDQ